MSTEHWVQVASESEIRVRGCMTAQVAGHTLALFDYAGRVYAVDNRCPHMGFPLKDGSVKEGILTCHWHHARFDLASGGAFDLFADDVRAFPVSLRDGMMGSNAICRWCWPNRCSGCLNTRP
jgi:nitrite reductase/ring-hydroxylating ferredoxin subunit